LGWPIQWCRADLGFAWYMEPATLVTQALVPVGSVETACAYMDLGDAVIRHKWKEIQAAGGLLILNDWRSVKTYDSGARRVLLERMRRRPKGFLRHTVMCLPHAAGPLLRLAVQTANLTIAMMGGGKVELCDDIQGAVKKHRLTGPKAGESFPPVVAS
jgi:hypothetical protein